MAFKKKQINDNSMAATNMKGSDVNVDANVNIEEKPFNCLKKEKVIVRFVPRQTGIVTDKDHVLFGGMSEKSKRTFVLKKDENDSYVNFLSDDEQRCLEKAMGLNEGDLNPNKVENNFFAENNKRGVSSVTLNKTDNIFDLSKPRDYIAYKLLLTNKHTIAPSINALQDTPYDYQFVALTDDMEQNRVSNKVNDKKMAWFEFGKIQDSIDSLRVVLAVFERKQTPPTTKINFLQSRLADYVDADPKNFLKIVRDTYFPTRVTILKAIDRGVIYRKGNFYYDKETNLPLCESGEDPTMSNACKYLNSVKNETTKFRIEDKIRELDKQKVV